MGISQNVQFKCWLLCLAFGISWHCVLAQNTTQTPPSGSHTQSTGLYRTIASLRGVNANGVADSLNRQVVITGTVHTINFRPSGLEFGISDFSGGMHIFKNTNVAPAYTVTQGDSVRVRGTVAQFRGLTQIVPDSVKLIQNNRNVKIPQLVTTLTEATEGRLLRMENLKLTSNSVWGGTGAYTAKALRGSNTTDTIFIRVDADALITYPRPSGFFNLIGHASQFSSSSSGPFTDGYQILPRSNFDFSLPYLAGVMYAYVANISSDNVSVINTTTNTVSATIPVGSGPGGVAVSPNGSKIYTTNQGSYSVSVVDAASQSVITHIPIPQGLPASAIVSPDGSRVYVATMTAGYVVVINALTNTVIGSIFISQDVSSVVVSPDGSKLYAASIFEGKVAVINAANNTVTTDISIGTVCNKLALSPDGSRLYATNYNQGRVAVINTSTNTVGLNISTGFASQGIAVSPDGSRVYVSNLGSDNVTIINANTNAIIGTTNLGLSQTPDGISVHPDGTKVYVAQAGTNDVSVISTGNYQVIAKINVGQAPYSTGNMLPLTYQTPCPTVTVSPNTLPNGMNGVSYSQTISQTGLSSATFSVTSGALPGGLTLSSGGLLSGVPTGSGIFTFTITATLGTCTGSRNYTLTINTNPNIQLAYVPDFNKDSVTVVNMATSTVQTKIKVGTGPIGVTVSPDGTRAYIANQNTDNISVINTSTNTVIATISVGNAPNHLIVNPSGTRLYVLNYLGSSVSVINTATNTVITTISTFGNPNGAAITPDGSKLYIGHLFSGQISIINTATNTVSGNFSSLNRPTGLAVNPSGTRLYIGHALSNNIRVFNTINNTEITNITVPGGVNGLAISPDGNRLYATNYDGNNLNFVTVINITNNSIVTNISTNEFPAGISVTPDGSKVLVARADWTTGGFTTINTATNSIITNVNLQSPHYSYGNMMALTYSACPTVTVNPVSLPNATAGSLFNQTISQTGLASATFAVSTGALPGGVTLSSSGLLSGTPNGPGTFQFTITATEGNCTGSRNYTWTVDCMTQQTPVISGNLSFCSGANTTLGIQNPVANSTYLWSTGFTGPNLNVTSAGAYTVRAVLSSCTSAVSQAANVTVIPLPSTPAISGNPTFCAGSNTTLSVQNPQANTSYLWSNGATGTSITITSSGSYSVQAIANTCTSAVSQPIPVSALPLPQTPEINGGLAPVCAGQTATLAVLNPQINVVYLWSNGATGPSIQVSNPGTFTVQAISNSCTSAASPPVSLNFIPLPGVPAIFGNLSFCSGANTTLSIQNPTPNTTYLWSNGDLGSNLLVTSAGSYTVRAISNTCTSGISEPAVVTVIPLPSTPVITGNVTFCAGGSSTLSVQSPQPNTTYLWNNGEIGSSLIVSTAGNYTVRAISNTCTSAISQPASIEVIPLPVTPVISGPLSFCAGGSTTLQIQSPQANTTYLWNNGDLGNNLVATTAGSYTVRAISNTCTSAVSQPATVSVLPLPSTPAITGNLSICTGASTTLQIENPLPGTIYLWNNGATGNSISVNSPGSYSVRAISNTCTSAISQPVSVTTNPPPAAPQIEVTGNNTCSVTLQAGGGDSYLWYLNANLLTVTSASFLASSSGDYTVKAVSAAGCTSMVSQPAAVNVLNLLAAPVASPAGPLSICQGDSIVLTASGAPQGSVFSWSNGPSGPNNVVKTTGTYTVTYASNGCNSLVSNAVSVLVNSLPTAAALQTGNSLFAFVVPGATYQWMLAGQPIAGATDTSYTPPASGLYAVQVTLNGCSSLSPVVDFQLVSIREQVLAEVHIFPNPTTEWVNIEAKGNAVLDIHISDQLGRQVLAIPAFRETARFRLSAGVYYVILTTEHSTSVKKLVVR